MKSWLNTYIEHARAHAETKELEVISHLWQVAWREGWKPLQAYVWEAFPKELVRRADQWALSMVLMPEVMAQYEAFDERSLDFRGLD
ncbi:MAG: hypothetical protein AAFS10_20515, partial [Myxococcota bacterium]